MLRAYVSIQVRRDGEETPIMQVGSHVCGESAEDMVSELEDATIAALEAAAKSVGLTEAWSSERGVLQEEESGVHSITRLGLALNPEPGDVASPLDGEGLGEGQGELVSLWPALGLGSALEPDQPSKLGEVAVVLPTP